MKKTVVIARTNGTKQSRSFLDRHGRVWPRDDGRFCIKILLLFCVLVVYLLTLPKGIGLGDAGTMAAAATSLGIPHPPGFPAFVLLGHLFSRIPLGSGLFRLQLLGVMGGIGLIGVIGMMESWSTAMLVAVLYGVWSQTGNVESYLLTNLCIFALVLTKKPSGILLGIASGLSPIGAVVVPALIFRIRRIRLIGLISLMALPIAVGLYSYLPLRASMHPFLNWGDPQTIASLYRHLTGGGLNINSPTIINGFVLSPRWIFDALARFGYLALVQLNIVLIGAVWGAITMYKKDVRKFWTLIIILIFNLFISGIYISGNRDLWLTTGLIVLVIFAGSALKKWMWPVAFVALLLVNRPFKANLTGQYLQDLYRDLPENSILIGGGETFNALSLYEYEVVKNKRVIPVDMTIFYGQPWYRKNLQLNTDLKIENLEPTFDNDLEFSRVLEKFVTENPSKHFFVTGYLLTTPIYANSNKPAYIPERYRLEQHGIVYRLVESNAPSVIPAKAGIYLMDPRVREDDNIMKYPFYLESNYQKAVEDIQLDYGLALEMRGDFFGANRVAPLYFDQNKLNTKIRELNTVK